MEDWNCRKSNLNTKPYAIKCSHDSFPRYIDIYFDLLLDLCTFVFILCITLPFKANLCYVFTLKQQLQNNFDDIVSYNRVSGVSVSATLPSHLLFLHSVTSLRGSDRSVTHMFTSTHKLLTHSMVDMSFICSQHPLTNCYSPGIWIYDHHVALRHCWGASNRGGKRQFLCIAALI